MNKLKLSVVAISLTTALYGCGQKTASEHIELAESHLTKQDINSAIIEYKNAISLESNNPELRLLLGELYLQSGLIPAAQKELEKALTLNGNRNVIVPILSRVYNLQLNNQALIDITETRTAFTPKTLNQLLIYRAIAYIRQNELTIALNLFEEANSIDTNSNFSKLGHAYRDYLNGQTIPALDTLRKAIQQDPDITELWMLKGQIEMQTGDFSAAASSYEHFHQLTPNTYTSKVYLANAYFKNKEYNKAEVLLTELLKVSANQPYINQLKGIIRFQNNDYIAAKLHSTNAIQNGLQDEVNYIVAGLSSFKLQNYEQAHNYLQSVKSSLSNTHPLQRLISALALKLGNPDDAVSTISSSETLTQEDFKLISMTSLVLAEQGKTEQIAELAERSKTISLQDSLSLIRRGNLQLSIGELDGFIDLKSALEVAPDSDFAIYSLVKALLDNGEFNQAIQYSKDFIAQHPSQATGYILAGHGYYALKDTDKALSMFLKAQSIDTFEPTNNLALASIYLEQKRYSDAKAALLKTLEHNRAHLATLSSLLNVTQQTSQTTEALTYIEEAYKNNSNSEKLLTLYVKVLYLNNQYSKIVQITNLVEFTDKTNEEFIWILISAELKLNNLPNAIKIANKWRSSQSDNPLTYIILSSLYRKAGDVAQAITQAQKGKKQFPKLYTFYMLETQLHILNNDLKTARETIQSLPEALKEENLAQSLIGKIELYSKNTDTALTTLSSVYEKEPKNENAFLVATAYKDLGDLKASYEFLTQHSNQYGNNTKILAALAELSILTKNYSKAIQNYEAILKLDSKHLKSLNNLSYLYYTQEEYQQALKYAEKALKLSPSNINVIETYSSVILKLGRGTEILEMLNHAYRSSKQSPKIALKLAEANIQSKLFTKAQKILKEVKITNTLLEKEKKRIENLIIDKS